jgi:hypothetical protein
VKIDAAKQYAATLARGQQECPGYSVKPKETNPLMWFAAFVMWPLSLDFMSGFTTTWALTTWMPRALIATNPWDDVEHELFHGKQYKASPVKYNLAYAFPQLLIVPALIAFWIAVGVGVSPVWDLGVLAFHPIGFVGMVVALAIAASPVWLVGLAVIVFLVAPAPWRAAYEREAYLMSMICDALKSGVSYLGDTRYRQFHIDHYTTGQYLFMLPFSSIVAARVDADLALARDLVNGTKTDPRFTPIIDSIKANAVA